MVLVSHKYKFIYIKNYKVAGSSVESFFGQFCINPGKKYNFNDFQEQSIDDYGIIGSRVSGCKTTDIWKNHINAKTIQQQLGDDLFNQYFKFAIIRNPYDVLVSAYFFEKPKLKFKEYAKTRIINCNYERCRINGKDACNYYIRYENLLEDVGKLCEILKIKRFNIKDMPKLKTGTRPKGVSYRDYYDEETRIKVYENHKKIFDYFGYKF